MGSKLVAARLAVSIVLLGCLSGCCSVNTGPFDAFSISTHSLLQGTDLVSLQIADVQRTFLIFAAAGGNLEQNSFEPTVDAGGHQQSIDLVRQFGERVAILEAVGHYADALTAFAKKDYQSAVDSASTKLDGSIVSLSKATGAGSEATTAAGYLATAVDALGHAIIEYERVKSLRQAMGIAQPGLIVLARRLAAGDDLIAQQIARYRKDILDDANATINANHSGIARVQISALVATPMTDANESIARLSELDRAVTLLPTAHQEVMDSLCSTAPNLTNLKELVGEGQRVAKFHSGLK
jgi:hypothetical protein